MATPLVSICILTWNRPKFLEMCIDDLLKKISDSRQCEILVLDNGSTDETGKILDKYRDNSFIRISRNEKHIGLNAYKKLFSEAKGNYIIEVDDDVLEFPLHFDKTMIQYMDEYTDYGFLALNVMQNENTNGAKPEQSFYVDDVRGDKTVEQGPAGGWCTCFRQKDYRKIKWIFNFKRLSFMNGEDAALVSLFRKMLKLKPGIIKDQICFHATGAYYAKMYGHIDREIEKYASNNLDTFVEHYKSFRDK